jgi:hypothetical protein
MLLVHFVDALAGSGKTHAAIRHAHHLARQGHKVLFVQPSITLIQQTLTDFLTLSPAVPVNAIHSNGSHGSGTSSNIVGDIVQHCRKAGPQGEVLIITHAAFLRVPYFHRPDRWHLLIDEIPQADWCDELNLAETHHLITNGVSTRVDESGLVGTRYARIEAKNRSQLQAMLDNKNGDEVWDRFEDFISKLLSPHWRTYVLDNQFHDLTNGIGDRRSLWTFGVLSPSLVKDFKSATIMGACFKESMLFHLWSAQQVQFRSHQCISKNLRYTRHENGSLLTIRYAAEEDWSKTFRDKALTTDVAFEGQPRTVLDHVAQSVGATFVDTPFVWMGNKDLPDNLFTGQARRLPNSPHGLNCFQNVHNVAVLSALNPPPAHFAFLESTGLDGTEVRRACYWQAVYQAVMRISVRNPGDQTRKTAIVMDRATADWLADLFPGCAVQPLDGLAAMPAKGKGGRRRKHLCDADRKAAHRDRFRDELATELALINGVPPTIGPLASLAQELRQQMTEFGRGRDQTLTTMGRDDLNTMAGTIFTSIFASTPFDFMPLGDVDTIIKGLRHFHRNEFENKQDNALISPAIFDPNLSEDTQRGLDNIRAVWGIWLDNDGGDLSPDKFARLFPRLRMAIFNSYSSTRDQPRWRVFIPTTIPLSVRAYKAVVGQIIDVVNKAGFWSAKQLADGRKRKSTQHHGFDMSKLVPSSLFYLPCQARNPDDSFFTDHHEERRAPLDPYQWVMAAANRARPEPEIVQPATASVPPVPANDDTAKALSPMQALRDQLLAQQAAGSIKSLAQRRDTAIEAWRSASPGEGNVAFYKLGMTLGRLGLDLTEITIILRQEALRARHPDERHQQIKSLLKEIRKQALGRAA